MSSSDRKLALLGGALGLVGLLAASCLVVRLAQPHFLCFMPSCNNDPPSYKKNLDYSWERSVFGRPLGEKMFDSGLFPWRPLVHFRSPYYLIVTTQHSEPPLERTTEKPAAKTDSFFEPFHHLLRSFEWHLDEEPKEKVPNRKFK